MDVFYPVCSALVVFCSVCSAVEVFCSALVGSSSVYSAIEVFCPICSAVVISCLALVVFYSAVVVCCSVCSVVVVLISTYTAGSVLVPALPATPWLSVPWYPTLTQSPASPLTHGPGPPSLPLFHLRSTTLLYCTIWGVSGSRFLGGRGLCHESVNYASPSY